MPAKRKPKAHGEIRQSQLVGTFGPGAMLDLPRQSVLVGGLEEWLGQGPEIIETRLVAKIKSVLNKPQVQLFGPPVDLEGMGGTGPVTGIRCFQFPEWFITQEDLGESKPGTRSRILVHSDGLTNGHYLDGKTKHKVVPVRFVRGCRKGHIGDIDWYTLVHGGQSTCRTQFKKLYLEERGATGDLSEISVRCQCGTSIDMLATTRLDQKILGHCDGNRPWLGVGARERCGEPNRLLVRTASNSYFAQKLSVISLPERDEEIRQTVDAVWEIVCGAETLEHIRYERKKPKVARALETITEEEMLREIVRRNTGTVSQDKPVKVAELETLIAAKVELGDDRPHGHFYARALTKETWNRPWMKGIERVVLIHRLREVVAQIGFTRFEPANPRTDGDLEIGVEPAALAREATWLPAVENRGEGIFLLFDQQAVLEWLNRDSVQKRGKQLDLGFQAWKKENPKSKREFPGVPFHMLHSFAHLLITSIALECGYPSSSIRERVYSCPGLGYGVLLYTGTSDAEGTLGGLIQVGRRIHEHIRKALDQGALCSNDPVCAEHQPHHPHEARFLHGAACHGCLLIAETCCEQQNDFLDRALVVPTVDHLGAEFFARGDQ